MSKGLPIAMLAAALGAGCALVLGIEDKPVVSPDAGEAGDAAEAGPLDPCEHTSPPPPPASDDDPATKATFVVAVQHFQLSERNDAGPIGYDLDDSCTCTTAPGSRHGGGPSCTSRTASPLCDGQGGIDNAFGALSFVTGATSDPKGNDKSTACGRGALLLVIQGYNGRANDSSIVLGPVPSPGLTTPHVTDGGETPSVCNDAGGLPVVYTPRWDGTDEWSSDTNYVGPVGTAQPLRLLRGYVRDWVLVAQAADGQVVTLTLGPIEVEASQTTIVATLEPLDPAGRPLPRDGTTRASSVRVSSGQISSRASAASVLKGMSNVNVAKIGYLCPGNPFYTSVKKSLCESLDVMTDPKRDFDGGGCDGISAAVGIVGEPAHMKAPGPPIDAGASPCATVESSCE